MALEQSLIEICSGLTSIRVNERKKSAESLKDMLSRSAMPSLLTENTRKKSGYTWNQVFNDIHEYILKETEKYETNKNFDNIIGTSTSLLNLCVSGSNKGGAHIKCDFIMEACLNIFNDIRLRKAIGDAYYSVLYKHVLNNDYYVGFITPSMWENLLEACVNLCLTNSSHLDILTKFKLLWLVIKNASNTVQFVVCLRDSLGDINKCLKKIMDDKKTQDFVMKIFILLVELLSTESRHMICEFTENVLPIIFKFYDHNMDVKKKLQIYLSQTNQSNLTISNMSKEVTKITQSKEKKGKGKKFVPPVKTAPYNTVKISKVDNSVLNDINTEYNDFNIPSENFNGSNNNFTFDGIILNTLNILNGEDVQLSSAAVAASQTSFDISLKTLRDVSDSVSTHNDKLSQTSVASVTSLKTYKDMDVKSFEYLNMERHVYRPFDVTLFDSDSVLSRNDDLQLDNDNSQFVPMSIKEGDIGYERYFSDHIADNLSDDTENVEKI